MSMCVSMCENMCVSMCMCVCVFVSMFVCSAGGIFEGVPRHSLLLGYHMKRTRIKHLQTPPSATPRANIESLNATHIL